MPLTSFLFFLAALCLGGFATPELARALLARRGIPPETKPFEARAIVGRLVCGCSLAAIAAVSWRWLEPLPRLIAVLGSALMGAVCLCDLRRRIIPWELSLCLLVLAVPFRLLAGGLSGLLSSLAFAVLLLAFLWVCNLLNGRRRSAPAIGAGDLRLVPALCFFGGLLGSIAGMLACSLLMGCAALFVLVARKAKRGDHIPLAPGLALWFLIGTLASTDFAAQLSTSLM